MPRSYRACWFILGAVTLIACKKNDEDDNSKSAQPATETPPPPTPPPPPAPVIVEGPNTNAGITSRMKQEVDNRTDPVAGNGLAVTGMKGSFTAPAGFIVGKQGEWSGAKMADGKAAFGAIALGPNDNPTQKRDMGAAAMGWTECQWGNNESVIAGPDKLPAAVADGTCKKDGFTVRTGFMQLMGEPTNNVIAIGGFADPGNDGNGMYAIFRSVRKGGTGEVSACCAAIKQNMASAPPQYLLGYQAALSACQAAVSNPSGYQAVKGMLAAVGAGGLCK